MIRIAFVNGKGGVGKTTCSMLVAAAMKEVGRKVSIDDRDPQGSATMTAAVLGIPIGTDGDVVVIDTPPDINAATTIDAIKTADLVVLVLIPSAYDITTASKTAGIIKKLRTGATRVLFNQVQTNNRFFEQIAIMSKNFPFPVFKNYLCPRTSYKVLPYDGWKAIPNNSRTDVLKLAVEIALAVNVAKK